jgi:hypothetical protein
VFAYVRANRPDRARMRFYRLSRIRATSGSVWALEVTICTSNAAILRLWLKDCLTYYDMMMKHAVVDYKTVLVGYTDSHSQRIRRMTVEVE